MLTNELYIFKKGGEKLITPHLSQDEVDCNCSYGTCKRTFVSIRSVESYEKTRTACGNRPLYMTNWFRCDLHNIEEGGSPDSKHKYGFAVDLIPPRGMELTELEFRAKPYWDYVQIYPKKNIVHCHNEPKS